MIIESSLLFGDITWFLRTTFGGGSGSGHLRTYLSALTHCKHAFTVYTSTYKTMITNSTYFNVCYNYAAYEQRTPYSNFKLSRRSLLVWLFVPTYVVVLYSPAQITLTRRARAR